METKHTPGPWRVLAHGGATYEVESHTQTESHGIDCNGFPCAWADHTEATARLIAAAPDLLRELLRLTDIVVAHADILDCDAAIDAATAAIAKATQA